MIKILITLTAVLSYPLMAEGQPTVLDPPNPTWSNTNAANIASYIPTAASITIDTIKSYHSSNRRLAFEKQALRTGLDVGITELIKILVSRQRPDMSDNKSFFSEHTELAAMGSSLAVSIPLGASAGYLRMAANKHYLTDVLTGLAAGIITSRLIKYTQPPEIVY
jgi:hypothetical protein